MSRTIDWRAALLLAGSLVLGGCVTDRELEAALDRDRDGYLPVQTGGDDCDETRASINPGADEICGDGIDNDCDGVPDDDGIGARIFYLDEDRDGFAADDAPSISACTQPEGYAPFRGDCDDSDPAFSPAADDQCDGEDDDCDGIVDDNALLTPRYPDADGDGFGVETGLVYACTDLPGFVLQSGDCDDADPTISPVVEDTCNGQDDNCNGLVDEDALNRLWFRDADGDQFGTELDTVDACEEVSGYVQIGGDCDDADAATNPAAFDGCDGVDRDCNGIPDDDVLEQVWYEDGDADGFGEETTAVAACAPIPGFTLVPGDCDDQDAGISPAIVDGCDGIDQDCNGVIDDDAVSTAYFEDLDSDGVGSAVSVEACIPPPGFSAIGGDCDDSDPAVSPTVLDLCDGVDVNCNGVIDDDAVFALYFADADGDGSGVSGASIEACAAPPDHVSVPGDCDDTDATVRPGAVDLCDGIDQDCDGAIDEAATFTEWFEDADGDGLGAAGQVASTCDGPPPDHVAEPGDCDDTDAAVTVPVWYRDADGDGFGVDTEIAAACAVPSGFAAVDDDCDDSDDMASPGAVEVCNNHRDDDCDPTTDCRMDGVFVVDQADLSLPAPFLPSIQLVPDMTGDAVQDWLVKIDGSIRIIDGTAPDLLGPGIDTPCTLGDARLIPDVDDDGRMDIACRTAPDRAVLLSSADQVEIHQIELPGSTLHTAPWALRTEEQTTVWAAVDDGVLVFDASQRLVDPSDQVQSISCPAGAASVSVAAVPRDSPNTLMAICESSDGESAFLFDALGVGANSMTSDASEILESTNMEEFAFVSFSSMDVLWRSTTVDVGSSTNAALAVTLFDMREPLPLSIATDVFVLPNTLTATLPAGDLDGDGWNDVLQFAALNTDQLHLLYGQPELGPTDEAAVFSGSVIAPDVLLPLPLGADVNEDGYDDIFIFERVGSAGTLHVFYGSGQ